MLTRIWAVLRSLYFLAIVGYAVWATPWMPMTVARTFDEQYARCANALSPLQKATWLAIAWIALEVVLGWMVVWRNSHADRAELKKALKEAKSTQPPPPPPPEKPSLGV
jgi:preprotein translocase subunit SecG